jgi:RNA polymerase sigma-70 factor (ECF subfamily)
MARHTAFALGREAWPGFAVSEARFAAYLEARNLGGGEPPAHAADLYLACACEDGDEAAIQAFDARYSEDLRNVVADIDSSPDFVDEACQRLHEKLFVASEEGRRRIVDYAGRGPLGGWLAVAALRTALNLKRDGKRELPLLEEVVQLHAAAQDPELDLIKARYRAPFRAAFSASFSALTPRQRNLLRLSLIENLSIDELGALLQTHRSTVARWIVKAREALVEGMRERLAKELKMNHAELDSLTVLMRSQLDISLRTLLRTHG